MVVKEKKVVVGDSGLIQTTDSELQMCKIYASTALPKLYQGVDSMG